MATTQTYATHRHNPRLTGIGFLFVLVAIVAFVLGWFDVGGRAMIAAGLAGLIGAIIVLLLISRLYTTALQDRIIRLEMRLRLRDMLQRIQHARIVITYPKRLTPFCFPIKVDSMRENLTSEKLEDRVRRMQQQLERW